MTITSLREAVAVAHTLSKPSKMPGFAYSLPADACKLGSILRKLPGTTCSKCYALKGRYGFPSVKAAMAKRIASISHPLWANALAFMINLKLLELGPEEGGFFRWHDSGDIQDLEHLRNICRVCELTPSVNHWLPTREATIVREYLEGGCRLPDNLTVRLSAARIGKVLKSVDTPTSAVGVEEGDGVTACRAAERGGRCGPCRACWDASVRTITYPLH